MSLPRGADKFVYVLQTAGSLQACLQSRIQLSFGTKKIIERVNKCHVSIEGHYELLEPHDDNNQSF